jgi:hypothetical protein
VVSIRPVKIDSIYANLAGMEEIKLPVITHMNDLARLDAHLFTYLEVKIRAF